ncbi:MAG: hypothetical protein HY591_05300 [Candidatus Omnitrophica bacterium]|nr:hypothetical protein [Candidatus Omnitrophota bacterium]
MPRSLKGAEPSYDFDPCTGTLASSNYYNWVKDSHVLARDFQRSKFQARAAYLRGMKFKAAAAAQAMQAFKTSLDTFLAPGGPAQKLSQALSEASQAVSQMPNFVVYGWQDPKPPNNKRAYWHIVRVEVQAPARCSTGKCCDGITQNCNINKLPWVKTYTKGFLGMTRCYELKDYNGKVGTRITRWDENHDAITFANKLPLWQLFFHKPGPLAEETMDTACIGNNIGFSAATLGALGLVVPDIGTSEALKGAFMFNAVPTAGPQLQCWNAVNQMLNRGVRTQTCAQYFLNTGTDGKKHLDLKFVSCPAGVFNATSTTP